MRNRDCRRSDSNKPICQYQAVVSDRYLLNIVLARCRDAVLGTSASPAILRSALLEFALILVLSACLGRGPVGGDPSRQESGSHGTPRQS
jgi:hypothetical protein